MAKFKITPAQVKALGKIASKNYVIDGVGFDQKRRAATATDGKMLLEIPMDEGDRQPDDAGGVAVVPMEALARIAKSGCEVELKNDGSGAVVEPERHLFKQIAATFPDTESVMPKRLGDESPDVVVLYLSTQLLQKAVEAARLICGKSLAGSMRFQIQKAGTGPIISPVRFDVVTDFDAKGSSSAHGAIMPMLM